MTEERDNSNNQLEFTTLRKDQAQQELLINVRLSFICFKFDDTFHTQLKVLTPGHLL